MGEGGVKIWSKFANGYLDKTADIGEGGVKNPEKIADVFYRRSLRSSQLPLELLFEWALSVDSTDHPDFKWFSGKVSNPKDKR